MIQWASQKGVEKTLGNFARRYKTMTDIGSGRVQALVTDKVCQEKTDDIFKVHARPNAIDISQTQGGQAWMDNTWMAGHATDQKCVGLASNGAAFLRIVALGSVGILVAPLKDLRTAATAEGHLDADSATEEVLVKVVEQLNDDAIAKYQSSGCKFYYHEQHVSEITYVPQGYVIVEHAVSGEAVVSMRKSYMTKSKDSFENYTAVKHMNEISKKPVQRMEWILKQMGENSS